MRKPRQVTAQIIKHIMTYHLSKNVSKDALVMLSVSALYIVINSLDFVTFAKRIA